MTVGRPEASLRAAGGRFRRCQRPRSSPLQASEKENEWVIRGSIVAAGLIGTSLTSLKKSLLVFLFLGAEVAYVVVFPQLLCVLFVNKSNGYGVVTGLLTGLTLKLLNGDPSLGLTPVLRYPACIRSDGANVQCVPVKTISMLTVLAAIVLFSYLAAALFHRGLLPERVDVFRVRGLHAASPLTPAGGAAEHAERRTLKRNDSQGQ